MKYDEYRYLWPPRPETKIPSASLQMYEKLGWIGQYKKNGTCNLVFVSPEKDLTFRTRHDEPHKLWSPTKESSDLFRKLPGSGWYVIVTELLHSKTAADIKDTHYIFDILVADGEYLVGKTFAERQQILRDLFLHGNEVEEYSHYVLNSNVWLAKTITSGFRELWNQTDDIASKTNGAPTDEGLVLKNPKAKLELCSKQKSNVSWAIKCRVSHKNYTF
jgi:hypothetical protein